MAKIENIQFILPVPGQSYTDIRPVLSGESWNDIRMTASELAYGVGNTKMGDLLSGAEKPLTAPLTSSQSILGDGVLFNADDHTYSKGGKPYLSGSTFAHMFEKEFPRDAIAQKVSDKTGNEVEDVLAAWDTKGQISLDYGTLIHKCVEGYLTFGADAAPSNEYLKAIVDDFEEVFGELLGVSGTPERFVQDDAHQLCGVIDFHDSTNHIIYDWKTGDIHQKVQNTMGKDWPNDRLSLYTLQLNFYKYILEQRGEKVKKLIIGWLNGEHWERVEIPIIDIKPFLEEVWKPTK